MKKIETTSDKILEAIGKFKTGDDVLRALFPDVFKSKNIEYYKEICDKLNVPEDDESIIVQVPGFDEGQINCVKAFIKKMRICEVYNGKKKLSFNEKRHYCWYVKNSAGAGLGFAVSTYDDDCATLSSAARLSFKDNASLMDFVKKFKYIDEQIIDLE